MKPTRGFTLLELIVSLSIVGVLGALCVPSFGRLQGRAKQAEARANLRALHDLEQSYYMSFDTYSASVARIGFVPTRSNRYQYNLVGISSAASDLRTGATARTPVTADAIMIDTFKFPKAYREIRLAPLKCGSVAAVSFGAFGRFLAAAQGRIGDGRTPDQWSIASFGRDMNACADVAGNVPAGDAANEQDGTARGEQEDDHQDAEDQ